jgi:hypothetical protein
MTCYFRDYFNYFNPDLAYPNYLSVKPLLLEFCGFWHLRESFWYALYPAEWSNYQMGMREVIDAHKSESYDWVLSANEILTQRRYICCRRLVRHPKRQLGTADSVVTSARVSTMTDVVSRAAKTLNKGGKV